MISKVGQANVGFMLNSMKKVREKERPKFTRTQNNGLGRSGRGVDGYYISACLPASF